MAVVTSELVKHVAHLARLHLEGQALEHMAAQLDEILSYVKQLEAVNTESIEPTTHVVPLTNVLRQDQPEPGLTQDEVMALAPAKLPPFVAVPKVLE